MIGDRIHLLELVHMKLAVSTSLALWLSEFATTKNAAGPIAILCFLLLMLCLKFGLDALSLLADLSHHLLGFWAQRLGWPGEAEVEFALRRHADLRRGGKWLWSGCSNIRESKADSRIFFLRAVVSPCLAWVHFGTWWLDATCGCWGAWDHW